MAVLILSFVILIVLTIWFIILNPGIFRVLKSFVCELWSRKCDLVCRKSQGIQPSVGLQNTAQQTSRPALVQSSGQTSGQIHGQVAGQTSAETAVNYVLQCVCDACPCDMIEKYSRMCNPERVCSRISDVFDRGFIGVHNVVSNMLGMEPEIYTPKPPVPKELQLQIASSETFTFDTSKTASSTKKNNLIEFVRAHLLSTTNLNVIRASSTHTSPQSSIAVLPTTSSSKASTLALSKRKKNWEAPVGLGMTARDAASIIGRRSSRDDQATKTTEAARVSRMSPSKESYPTPVKNESDLQRVYGTPAELLNAEARKKELSIGEGAQEQDARVNGCPGCKARGQVCLRGCPRAPAPRSEQKRDEKRTKTK